MVDRAVSRDRIGACRGLGVACRRGQGWVIFTVLVLLDDGCFDPLLTDVPLRLSAAAWVLDTIPPLDHILLLHFCEK